MKLILQRTIQASVAVEGKKTAAIRQGIAIFTGISQTDTQVQAAYLARRVSELRIFQDESGRMNRSIHDIRGSVLAVPNFTLYGDCSRGRRPSFASAARPELALLLFDYFAEQLRATGIPVETGLFGANMEVSVVNDVPATFILERDSSG